MWPQLRGEASTKGLNEYKNDLHFVLGELHPLHPFHTAKFGLSDINNIKPKEALLTLRTERDLLLLTIWEKELNHLWKERGFAIFTYATYALIDLEILPHPTIRIPVPREA
jgi:hypothetical protein